MQNNSWGYNHSSNGYQWHQWWMACTRHCSRQFYGNRKWQSNGYLTSRQCCHPKESHQKDQIGQQVWSSCIRVPSFIGQYNTNTCICQSKRKYTNITNDDTQDDYDTENEKAAAEEKVKSAGDSHSDKRSIVVQKDTLDQDEVTCKGCNKKIKLDKKKEYATRPWDLHKKKCAIITGKKCVHAINWTNNIVGVHLSFWQATLNININYLVFENRLTAN